MNGHSTNQLIIGPGTSSSKITFVTSGSANKEYIKLSTEALPPCPLCGVKTNLYFAYMEDAVQTPDGNWTTYYDINLTCQDCGFGMTEYSMSLDDGAASVITRYSKRPKREQVSLELAKLHEYLRYDRYMQRMIDELGPFTHEEVEKYFGSTNPELVIIIRDLEKKLKVGSSELYNQHSEIVRLKEQLAQMSKGAENKYQYGGESQSAANWISRMYTGQGAVVDSKSPYLIDNVDLLRGGGTINLSEAKLNFEAFNTAAQQWAAAVGQTAQQAMEGLANGLNVIGVDYNQIEEIRREAEARQKFADKVDELREKQKAAREALKGAGKRGKKK